MDTKQSQVKLVGYRNLHQLDLAYPSSATEVARKRMLELYGILDTASDANYDEIAKLAGVICDVPLAAITFLDGERQWFKSTIGADLKEAPVAHSFCTYTVATPSGFFSVEDATADERFCNQPHVVNPPFLKAYAGASLLTKEGVPLGTICVYDVKQRSFTQEQQEALLTLSRQVIALLDLSLQVGQLKIQERQLLASNEQLTQFASMISHDLNAPIRHQVSFAKIFEEEFGDLLPEEAKLYLKFIKEAGDKALGMMVDLREYVNTTRAAFVSLEPVALDELIEEVLGIEYVSFKEKVEVQVDTTQCNILMTSRTALRHILLNLVSNALKYSQPNNSLVKIWTDTSADRVAIHVEDNGPGIDDDDRKHIFDPFGRGKSSINKPGRGLGLSIASQLAKNLGGHISLTSALGKGAKFSLIIPVA